MVIDGKGSSGSRKTAVFIALLLGTAAAGWVIALTLGFLMASLLRGQGGFADLGGVVLGLFGGYPLGVWLGQLIARRAFHVNGSLLIGLVGVVLGIILTVLLSTLLHLNASPNVLLVVYGLLVPLLGTAGYLLRK